MTTQTLTEDQAQRIETLLRSNPVTSFDIQRALFEGKLNKESAAAIKAHIASLLKEGAIKAEGVKRGRKYSWS